MRLATSKHLIRSPSDGEPAARWTRLDYERPDDVLADPILNAQDKRAVLCSWASDASAVRDEPTLRWLLGTPAPVRLEDIRAALARLEAAP